MANKYNSKKHPVENVLGPHFSEHIKHQRTYRNTDANWQDLEEQKERAEKNEDLLKYSYEGNKKLVRVALTTGVGADINAVDESGNNALIYAVYSSDLATVKYLLNYHKDEEGFDIPDIEPINLNHLNNNGLSALHLAVILNNNRIVKELLSAGINANIVGNYVETPIFVATRKDNQDMIDILKNFSKANSANINAVNGEGHTPLIVASQNRNRQEAFLKLLELGANMLAKDFNGRNAFMHSANNNCSAMMDIMLKRTPNFEEMVNNQDINGVSTMMILAKRGNREALRVLIARGANPFLKDNEGNMAVDYAIMAGNSTCKEILQKTQRIYEKANLIENKTEKQTYLKTALGEFAKQNRVENSCIK